MNENLNTENIINADGDSRQVELLVIPPTNTFENIDCMEMLRKCPPKHFDLAIVDPPYGIWDKLSPTGGGTTKNKPKFMNSKVDWDTSPPPQEYFDELFRVSKNQIIWGGNNFNLPTTRCFIVWDKLKGEEVTFSKVDYAWTSFNRLSEIIRANANAGFMMTGINKRIHPTQKPIELYRKILMKYADEGDLILDTHVGSGSSLIACIEGGFNYYGCEIDNEYYEAAKKRIGRAFRKYELAFADEAV
ncbi:MAG: putative DNA methylase [Ignavibacteria bacterium]|nr:MAG: putative DNA methylase [Ignavibacteria bacterium]KAF0155226.1 MAG: putative DNA methylase [Ignavibacteria bacterium]